jgi:hypothetical protein
MKKTVTIDVEDTNDTKKLTHQEFIDIIEGALMGVGFKVEIKQMWFRK